MSSTFYRKRPLTKKVVDLNASLKRKAKEAQDSDSESEARLSEVESDNSAL